MTTTSKSTTLIAFAGSTRQGSINQQALDFAVEGARVAGATVDVISLKDFFMPLYDADWHTANGVPDSVRELRQKMIDADGLLIASPEYNSSITPLLKNTIDWLSQSAKEGVGQGSGRAPFEGKITGLLGASAGAFGGIRALPHVSFVLSNLGAIVLPVLAIPAADKIVDTDGNIANERAVNNLKALGASVANLAASSRVL
jgi:chromate reductase, NAD(P)H dehydrogenase (quinone)